LFAIIRSISLLYTVLLACLVFGPADIIAEVTGNPDKPGPLELQTIEFADLHDNHRGDRRVPIKIHLPVNKGPWPVIIVSHGAGGHWDANYAQALHLASHGYAVFCLEHIGSNTARLKQGWRFIRNLKAMTRDSDEVLNRPTDISFALDCATIWNKEQGTLRGLLDLEHVGVLGHSFGAYTTLVVCGMRPALDWLTPSVGPGKGLGPDLSDPRVDAGVALSPQGPGEPFFHDASYQSLNRPLLGITGSKDKQQGAPPENRRRFFELIPAGGKVFIWLNNADHTAFSDSSGTGLRSLHSKSRNDVQPIVRASTLLFFDAWLKGNKEAEAALSEHSLRPLLRGVVDGLEVHKK